MVVTGQVHGGVATGIGQALFEEVAYDLDGNPVSGNLVSYGVPRAAELPPIETVDDDRPSEVAMGQPERSSSTPRPCSAPGSAGRAVRAAAFSFARGDQPRAS